VEQVALEGVQAHCSGDKVACRWEQISLTPFAACCLRPEDTPLRYTRSQTARLYSCALRYDDRNITTTNTHSQVNVRNADVSSLPSSTPSSLSAPIRSSHRKFWPMPKVWPFLPFSKLVSSEVVGSEAVL
jgi:hypothetical protein